MTENVVTLVHTIRQLSTEVAMLVANYQFAQFVVALTFGLDLLIILLTLLVQRFVSKHLTIRPMGERMGWTPYYTKWQLSEIERVFRKGLSPPKASAPLEDRVTEEA